MAVVLDLADIQGNILTAYGKQGFPKGRCITLNVIDPAKARQFVTELMPWITTALRWKSRRSNAPVGAVEMERPKVAVNIAFTFPGLLALGIPTRTLRGMPDEFIDGMLNRASMLGDNFNDTNPMKTWDTVWTAGGSRLANRSIVHILITLNAQMNPDGTVVQELETTTKYIEDLCTKTGGVSILAGHSQPDVKEPAKYQELTAITYSLPDGTVVPSPKEHFDYTDGIGDPIFEGQYPGRHEQRVAQGNGAVDGAGKWRPLATGEFLLGYPDEAQEIPGSAMPLDFSRNGTFMAYRKLHQNVASFRSFIKETAERFAAVFGINDPNEARELLMAKIAGRWQDGVPVARAPNVAAWKQFNIDYPDVSPAQDRKAYLARQQAFIDFTYADDMGGLKCPMTSHVRRTNTRDGLAPTGREGSALNNRRRIIRRGLPYGDSSPDTTDSAEHGIIMFVVCASLVRQFEFVQQQWINYGLDAQAGNDACPLVGNHSTGNALTGPKAKYVIPADPKAGHAPFIVEGIPQFVETRGGDYFFVPSMTALRMIGMGTVDPT